MASENSPFEWLSGGLFFNKKGGIEGVDSEKDAKVLISGIDENLKQICLGTQASSSAAAAAPAVTDGGSEESPDTPARFLEARSQRLRFLLYEERRIV